MVGNGLEVEAAFVAAERDFLRRIPAVGTCRVNVKIAPKRRERKQVFFERVDVDYRNRARHFVSLGFLRNFPFEQANAVALLAPELDVEAQCRTRHFEFKRRAYGLVEKRAVEVACAVVADNRKEAVFHLFTHAFGKFYDDRIKLSRLEDALFHLEFCKRQRTALPRRARNRRQRRENPARGKTLSCPYHKYLIDKLFSVAIKICATKPNNKPKRVNGASKRKMRAKQRLFENGFRVD